MLQPAEIHLLNRVIQCIALLCHQYTDEGEGGVATEAYIGAPHSMLSLF